MLVASLLAIGAFPRPSVVWTLNVDGVTRTAQVYEGMANGPVVIGFHGHGGSGRITARTWGFQDRLPDVTFIYPDGLPTAVPGFDPEGGRPGWQVREGQNQDRDIKFVTAIRNKAGESRPTIIGGHSNGAFFTLLLWSQTSADFKGAFEVAGAGLYPVNKKIPLLAVAGKQDTLIPFRSQENLIERVSREIGARESTKSGFLTKHTGLEGAQLWTYIHDGGHAVPSSVEPVFAEFVTMTLTR